LRQARRAALALCAALALGAAAPEGEPLEAEQAFPVEARLVVDSDGIPRRIDLRFTIHDGYYLYANRFKVEAPGLPAGALTIPAGILKDDPFVGKSRILREAVTVEVPLAARPAPGQYSLAVTAQGCAENLVCYAPFTQSARIAIP
jgi:thiol:disulfide interchange protein DsbD